MNHDFSYPFAATKDLLAVSDLTVVNLEAPLIQNCPPHESGFKLCGRPGFAAAMQLAKVDIATLENNHIANYGRAGVAETVKYFDAAKIAWADRQTPSLSDVRGVKFGFLAFNGVAETINRQQMTVQIKTLRPKVDVLVVAMHWGAEYVTNPQNAPGIANDAPGEIAHLVIDAGADLIIGNHPHWVQPVEIYKGKFITYAHGNFIFDQMWSYETRVGVIGRYTFYDRALVQVEYVPVLIENYARPVPMQSKEAQAVLDQIRAASEEWARGASKKGNK